MLRKLCLVFLIGGILTGWLLSSAPKAEAIDPVTIAILTPIALKAAQVASPYILKGLQNMGVTGLKALKDIVELFKLPIGLGLMLFGWPFGAFKTGFQYTIQGGIAPFKLVFHVIMMPISAFGIRSP